MRKATTPTVAVSTNRKLFKTVKRKEIDNLPPLLTGNLNETGR
jgi:hypothetical protein